MEFVFEPFTEEDVAPMTAIMTAAFNEDSRMFRGVEDGPKRRSRPCGI